MIVKVGPIPYGIEFVDPPEPGNEAPTGRVSYAQSRIEIVKSMTLQLKRVVLLHELIHCILTNAGVDQENHDEEFVDAIAFGMLDMLTNNPELVSYLGVDG